MIYTTIIMLLLVLLVIFLVFYCIFKLMTSSSFEAAVYAFFSTGAFLIVVSDLVVN